MKKRVSLFHYLIGAFIIIACFSIFQNINAKTKCESDRAIARYESVLIYEGDSVWSIAEAHLKDASYDELVSYVEQIKSINHISQQGTIYSGRYIIIPIYEDFEHI